MLSTAIQAMLTLITTIIPSLSSLGAGSTMLDNIIASLATVIPTITPDMANVATSIKGVIASLQQSGNVTPAQMQALQQLDAQCDAAFDAAAGQAGV